jgi:hypothetical protein
LYPNQIKLEARFDLIYLFASLQMWTTYNVLGKFPSELLGAHDREKRVKEKAGSPSYELGEPREPFVSSSFASDNLVSCPFITSLML